MSETTIIGFDNSNIVQFDEYRIEESYLTGRSIIVNEGIGFLIPPTFSEHALHNATHKFFSLLSDDKHARKNSKQLHSLGEKFSQLKTRESLAIEVTSLIAERIAVRDSGWEAARMRDLLVVLWQEGCFLFPQMPHELFKPKFKGAWPWGETVGPLVEDFEKLQSKNSSSSSRRRAFLIMLLSRGGVNDAGDLTPNVCSDFFSKHAETSPTRASTVSDMITLQTRAYGAKVVHSMLDYGPVLREAVRSDDEFQWVLKSDLTLDRWVDAAKRHMLSLPRNRSSYFSTWNRLFDFLIKSPDVTRDPATYLHAESDSGNRFKPEGEKANRCCLHIYDWILEHYCIYEDEYGGKAVLPGYQNPLTVTKRKGRPLESHRPVMPTYILRRLTEVLTENDFAWPRLYGISRWNRKGGDMLRKVDPSTGEETEIWSPVRAIAIFVKLKLPPRTLQVRVLDSGEADRETFFGTTRGWAVNLNPLAAKNKTAERRGVFYRYVGQDGIEYTFLYFNTNKTGDIGKEDGELGYVMQWQHAEVLDALVKLRDWQEAHNPIHQPTPWTELKELSIRRGQSPEILSRRGRTCFLFRDACSPLKSQPVTDMRLDTFWLNLNAELEKRMLEAGEVGPDNQPFKLVFRNAKGAPTAPRFDLHSLRVTHISAYAEAGVPTHIVMKVVHHEAISMFYHYTKISPVHISDTLNASTSVIANKERDNWIGWLSQQARSTLISAAAYCSVAAVDALASAPRASWVIRDHGICPVGCSRCHEGGELVINSKAYKKYGPVPGGANNCVRCRFFLSGPAFLLGLQSYFDMVGFQLREASRNYQTSKQHFESLEADYLNRKAAGEPVSAATLRTLEQAAGIYDQNTQIVDDKALSWHAAYRLIGQSLAIARKQNGDTESNSSNPFPLIAASGVETVEAVLEASTEFELADRVCQSSVFFQGIDPSVPNLKRMRAFDAMLQQNGMNPCFFDIDEQQALEIGNQFSKLLFSRLGRMDAQRLMAGSTTLKRLGITCDFSQILGRRIHLGSDAKHIDFEPVDASDDDTRNE